MLFGTVEYFEREIYNYLNENQLKEISEDSLSVVTSKLKKELLYDFVCDERIRLECLENLKYAIRMITQSKEAV
ncbi:hypothetical protein RRV45_19620 [Bacillus sp. DTU_2020_1000418_1_SI_GHA_SEK_038]|uniref:hypothetical protein n=1 Tax=Bacillus sp. DTU_2020_1000418_1_SI_GHA_SEK_038 TaxID=3077585 RepID=UPI0028E1AAAB|nr:hypothetical protein [Bacillus sp. DTU_2020_1000418_1_SI_GHA_SEK_038]WNS77659.1 hypothetical protein RRV45_19620 [Bacillus sp. DTU_2020_1000418_1_SI_GHA_SEK_038]